MSGTKSTPDEQRRIRPNRRAFTETQIVDAALALLDEGGVAAVSIRSVATRLGVNPNAIYTYVASRADLERAVVERVLGAAQLARLTDPDPEWRTAIIEFALELRTLLLEHPAVATLLMSAPMDGVAARDLGEALLDCLARGGLSAADGARAAYAIMVQTIGSVALEVAETDGKPPLSPESERITLRRTALDTIDGDRWPHTRSSTDVMAQWISADQFAWGLRALLDGLPEKSGRPAKFGSDEGAA
ncbi:TetR/AcrR family transcriptional regulator [Nocardia sp. NPDC050710]|uniref:TetR/AcrR family transcriptional regulator n=1 Tax=Nocardia sp. NPDC050710 TaxID=3157220 RepID=UPI0033CE7404